MSAPRDPGLQPERTELAWRRTALSFAVGSLVSLRVLPPVLGDWAVGVGGLGLALAAVLWVLARRRQLRVQEVVLRSRPTRSMPGGGLLLALAVGTTAAAALGLVFAGMLAR